MNIRTIILTGVMACLVTVFARAGVSTFYSPQDDCEWIWVETINAATNHVYVSCYGISNKRIVAALIAKHKRGVLVKVCCDKLQAAGRSSQLGELADAGIEVVIKKTSVLEHNKMLAVDGKTGIIGSWNLSGNAQKQDNSLVLFSNETNFVREIENAWRIIYTRDK